MLLLALLVVELLLANFDIFGNNLLPVCCCCCCLCCGESPADNVGAAAAAVAPEGELLITRVESIVTAYL